MTQAQIELQNALTTTFLANLAFLSEYDKELYYRIDELSRMIENGTYQEKYALEFIMEKGEFDKILFKRWEKKVYEVYFQKNNRVFYITVDKENIYLLHSCRKQKNKTEKKDANIVRKRAKELGNMLGRKFI